MTYYQQHLQRQEAERQRLDAALRDMRVDYTTEQRAEIAARFFHIEEENPHEVSNQR